MARQNLERIAVRLRCAWSDLDNCDPSDMTFFSEISSVLSHLQDMVDLELSIQEQDDDC